MRRIINSLLASMLLVGCTTDIDLGIAPAPTLEPFYASIEGSTTRTYVGAGDKLLWSADDRITIFDGSIDPREYRFVGDDGATDGPIAPVSSASVDVGTTLSANYAIYPHSASATITDAGVINYTIPATQTYAANSFGLGANVMVAVSEDVDDRNFAFKNVGGYFEFSLYGDDVTVKSIVFSGNNDEKLAGDATITATYGGTPSIAFAYDAMTALTLDCGEGVELGTNAEQATKFWLVVPAMTYTNGITITIIDTDGKVMQKTTSNPITINRSTVQPLTAFEVEATPILTNQIWYTSTDGKVVAPIYETYFGANLVSNVYENGIGVITFDGNVTSIYDSRFFERSTLKSIIIPNSVQTIGNGAFYNCSSLESIIIPAGVESIDVDAFMGCSSLKSVTIPEGVQSIGNNAFYGCSLLKSVTIPAGVQSIGDIAFYNCSSLESVTIPNSVTSIGHSVFMGCLSLTSVTLPENATAIPDFMFNGCSSLESITIPEGVQSIGQDAFCDCSSLKSITIPAGVESIGQDAFMDCSLLTTIYCKPVNPPALYDEEAFFGNSALTKIYVPASSETTYKEAQYWSEYASIIEGYDF